MGVMTQSGEPLRQRPNGLARTVTRAPTLPAMPREAERDFSVLVYRFRLPGGNIRNILVAAAHLAAADENRSLWSTCCAASAVSYKRWASW